MAQKLLLGLMSHWNNFLYNMIHQSYSSLSLKILLMIRQNNYHQILNQLLGDKMALGL